MENFRSAFLLLVGLGLLGRGDAVSKGKIDMESWLSVFGDGFAFELPDMEEVFSETNTTASIMFGHRAKPGLLQANGLCAKESVIENCGPAASDLSVTWEPSGPLIIGNKYTGRFQATAIHHMYGTGHVEPEVYRDGERLFPYFNSLPFCKFLPAKYREKTCDIEEGEKLDFSYTGTIPTHRRYIKEGRYHGNMRFLNGKHQLMLCVSFDVTLLGR